MSDDFIYRTIPEEMAELWNNFLPGIDRVVLIAGDGDYSDWIAAEWLRKGDNYDKKELLLSEEISIKLLKTRQHKSDFQWITNQQIPFYTKHEEKSIGQLTLFNEDKYLILVVRVKLPGRTLSDVFYLFFRNDKSNFGISHDSTPIDTSQKSIIGILAVNFAMITFDNLSISRHNLEYIKQQVKELLVYHTTRQDKTNNRGLSEWKRDWAQATLNEIGERDGVNYVYRDDALKLLTENSYSHKTLKQALEEAIKLARLMTPLNSSEDVIIESFYVKFTDVTSVTNRVTPQSETETIITRMDKAFLLLDKLENASQKLLLQNIQPSSERVGKAMEQPITAPAIRDALKKHQSRVLQLLNKYPDRWLYVRSQFRPVINLFPKNNPGNIRAV